MKFGTLSAIKLVLLGSLSLEVAANSGYAASCNSIYFTDPGRQTTYYTLLANCRENSGIYKVDSQINLGSCFGNSGGKLVAMKNGAFGASCKDVSLSGTVLKASCGNGAGAYVSTSIDTNNYIGNANGLMCCYNACVNEG
ncbi:hypothetical protein N7478_001675 [Penicillium angulare]|uniref:uncharacterized protein n=1 Tax=Penicillium angulare TaxID=116970 RepID=UPI002541DF16|nr:uncharacterized protein N7478_001675 [Penicillium angulare]KAJ5288645.1 hypothetical protein N7478_001675 [Penicillium angulare]